MKPFFKVFGGRTVDEIANSRLFRLKQRTLPWRLDIAHLPGKLNYAADATSRHPSASSSNEHEDKLERMMMASIHNEAAQLGIISLAHVARETLEDTALRHLLCMVDRGEQDSHPGDSELSAFLPIRHSIDIDHGVLMYQDRVVVPPTLRPHSAHKYCGTYMRPTRVAQPWSSAHEK